MDGMWKARCSQTALLLLMKIFLKKNSAYHNFSVLRMYKIKELADIFPTWLKFEKWASIGILARIATKHVSVQLAFCHCTRMIYCLSTFLLNWKQSCWANKPRESSVFRKWNLTNSIFFFSPFSSCLWHCVFCLSWKLMVHKIWFFTSSEPVCVLRR